MDSGFADSMLACSDAKTLDKLKNMEYEGASREYGMFFRIAGAKRSNPDFPKKLKQRTSQ